MEADTAAAETTSVEDRQLLERRERKDLLMAQLAVLSSRQKALKSLVDDKRAALLLLMEADGESKRRTSEGTASRTAKRTFNIHDREKLLALFDTQVLMEQVKVTAAFYDAAKKADVDIDTAVSVESDGGFKFSVPQTKAAKERQQRVMDETKLEMERRVEHLARMMRNQRRAT